MTKNKSNFLNDSVLSIQVSLGGFSFVFFDKYKKDWVTFSKQFQKQNRTPEDLLESIKKEFQHPLLQKKHTKIELIHWNTWSTLVPNIFFDESHLPEYLEHTTKVFSDDFIAHDDLEKNTLVYIPFVNVNNYFFDFFGAFDYYHIGTKLLRKIRFNFKSSCSPALYVNVCQKQMMVIYWHQDVKFYNSFVFEVPEDFLYYILFVLEQLCLPLDFPIWLSGDVSIFDKNYRCAREYLKTIAFIPSENKRITHQYLHLI